MAEKIDTKSMLEYLSLLGGAVTLVTSQNLLAAALVGSLGGLRVYREWSTASTAKKHELTKQALHEAVANGTVSAEDAAKLLKEMP